MHVFTSAPSISRRFSLSMISVITIIIFGFTLAFLFYQNQCYKAELQERLTLASKLAEMSLSSPLWYYNYDFLEDFLRALFLDKVIVFASIVVDDEVIVENVREGLEQTDWSLLESSPGVVTQATEIQYENKPLGYIRIAASKASLVQKLLTNIVSTTVLALLLILAILITSILVTKRYITRPLANMMGIAAKISNGEVDAHLGAGSHFQITQNDELGILARGFQGMIGYLQQMVSIATQISFGDVEHDFAPRTEHDVLGLAFQRMIAYLQQVAQIATLIAQGNLCQRPELRSVNDRFGNALSHMTKGLITLIANIRMASEHVSSLSTQVFNGSSKNAAALEGIGDSARETSTAMLHVSGKSDVVREHTEKLSRSVEETSSFLIQMSSSIRQVAENSQNLSQFADKTSSTMANIVASLKRMREQMERSKHLSETTMQDALAGQESVKHMIASMTVIADITQTITSSILRMNDHSQEITRILDVINDVAEQTSLLALNASIISAQAGSQGKGFAVVAEEIKELAIRTRTATKEIADIVKTVRRNSSEAVEAIRQGQREVENGGVVAQNAGEAMQKIRQSAMNSAAVVTEIDEFMGQQTTLHTGIAESFTGVSLMINEIARAIHEQELQTERLTTVVENMRDLSAQVLDVTCEQQQDTSQVAELMQGVLSLVEQNYQTVFQLLETADELANQANVLNEHVTRFRIPEL
ncbi:methyl-accepting chemotaxis protein [Candidatus Vecturithrix granuli]|uniref:Methyl-accepting chemotaxis protein n=1 Tax=Vecturithrix granuli TaxID=1499967 RepID=A0A081C3G7_VECG1|nr:methyl-accepting chemotaxis protein [Candidatus Vecturithrix granuli]